MVKRAMLFLLLLASLRAAGESQPTFSVGGSGVAIQLPAAVLTDAAVRRHLESGLTTTFRLAVRQRDGTLSGARIEMRYDLWDEVWIVHRRDLTGASDRQRLTSREALERWWRAPIRLFSTTAGRVALQVDLEVLPFSTAEEEDARKWIAKSGGVGTAGSGSGFVDALIGTTLSTKPLTTFRWRIELAVKTR